MKEPVVNDFLNDYILEERNSKYKYYEIYNFIWKII